MITTGTYANVEYQVYNSLIGNIGLNIAAACGVLANIKAESSFNPNSSGDSGSSYGLCQWHNTRKTALEKYCNTNGLSYTTVAGQMAYLKHELETGYKSVYSTLKGVPDTAQGAYDAAYAFSLKFERPAGGETSAKSRGNTAKNTFFPHYKDNPNPSSPTNTGASYTGSYEEITGNNMISAPEVGSAINYEDIQLVNPQIDNIKRNLESVEAEGFDYGYLIDMDHDKEFKFYIPEFSDSAGAKWSTVDIPGRSVDITYYTSTSSRSINISLDLYAGEGLYKEAGESFEEAVTRLHDDLNFLRSLEYPDYTSAIAKPPARVHLILGSSIDIEGIVEGMKIDHKKPIDSQNRSIYVRVSFTVKQVANDPPDYNDILSGVSAMISTNDTGTIASNDNASVLPNTDVPGVGSITGDRGID